MAPGERSRQKFCVIRWNLPPPPSAMWGTSYVTLSYFRILSDCQVNQPQQFQYEELLTSLFIHIYFVGITSFLFFAIERFFTSFKKTGPSFCVYSQSFRNLLYIVSLCLSHYTDTVINSALFQWFEASDLLAVVDSHNNKEKESVTIHYQKERIFFKISASIEISPFSWHHAPPSSNVQFQYIPSLTRIFRSNAKP